MTTNQTPAKRGSGSHAVSIGPKGQLPKKPKKPMPKFMVAVWTFLVFLLLLGGAGYCLYANVGGIAEKALVLLPQYKASLEALDKRQKDLEAREAKLMQDNGQLESAVKANDQTAAELTAREEKLTEDRKAFESTKEEAKSAEERKQAVVAIYTSLDAGVAASMLLKAPTMQEAAGILQLLPADKAAEILTEVEATDAARAYSLAKLIGQ